MRRFPFFTVVRELRSIARVCLLTRRKRVRTIPLAVARSIQRAAKEMQS
jgi:hypothetical protein